MFSQNKSTIKTKSTLLTILISSIGLVIVLFSVLLPFSSPASAATTSTLNFQGRLFTSSGSTVPDGFYNLEFKLYDVSSGGVALWTDSRYDQNGVTAGLDYRLRVVNGYFSVYLGDTTSGGTAFPSTINWDQELWLTINVGGTTQTATPTWDGEMTPRTKLSAVPYAFRAQTALGVSSNNTTTASTNSGNVTIQTGNATGTTSSSGNLTIDTGTATATAGTISLGTTTTSGITIGRSGIATLLQGNIDLAATTTLSTRVNTTTYTTPGSANNVTLNASSLYRLDTSGAAQTLTGIAAGRDGQRLILMNIDASLSVTLANNSGSSSDGNRLITGTGADVTIPAGGAVELIYDSTGTADTSFWRLTAATAGSLCPT